MQFKRIVSTGLAVTALVVGLVGCGGGGSSKAVGSKNSSADVVASDNPTPHFAPNTLRADSGSDVSFTLKNEGKVVHNFTVSLLGIDKDVQPGQTVPITFNVPPPKKGETFYTFYDKNFQGEGMQGRINVG